MRRTYSCLSIARRHPTLFSNITQGLSMLYVVTFGSGSRVTFRAGYHAEQFVRALTLYGTPCRLSLTR